VDQAARDELIARYADGGRVLREAVQALSDAELDRAPAPGEWSARQIIHHTADSELTSAIRLRKLLAEDRPVLQGYDEELFARGLFYDRPIASSLAAVDAARASTLTLLRRMSAEQWAREGVHSESGGYTAEDWLRI
jgi:hypothetical protein